MRPYVLVNVRIARQVTERLSKRKVGDDVEGKVLRLAAKIEGLAGCSIFGFNEVNQAKDILVNLGLEILDLFARVLKQGREK